MTQKATLGKSSSADFEFQLWVGYIAQKNYVTGPPAIAAVVFNTVTTTCSGDSEFGCTASSDKANVNPTSYEFRGFAPTKLDVWLPSGTNINVGTIALTSAFSAGGTATSRRHDIECLLLADPRVTVEDLECEVEAVAIASWNGGTYPQAFPSILLTSETYDVTNTNSGTYTSSATHTFIGSAGNQNFLESFTLQRDGYNGASQYAPVKGVVVGCGDTSFSHPTATINHVGVLKDQDSSPWAWYDAAVECRSFMFNQ